MACVYALSSSLDPTAVRYIGRSNADNAITRLKEHLKQAHYGTHSHKYNWIRSVQAAGGKVVATVLESGLSWDESGIREIFFIANHRSLGSDLTNATNGGDGVLGRRLSAVVRAQIGAGNKGKTHSAQSRAKISAGNKGKIRSPETRTKISVTMKGRLFSDEHRANLSVAMMGKTNLRRGKCGRKLPARRGRHFPADMGHDW